MSGICLAAGGLAETLPLSTFTLAWTHSIEKIRWEEDYRVVGKRLALDEARIRGSGAGMEPPVDARLDGNGVWHYRPKLAPLERLRLSHSPYAGSYEICSASGCRPLAAILGKLPEFVTVEVAVCGAGVWSRVMPVASAQGCGRSLSMLRRLWTTSSRMCGVSNYVCSNTIAEAMCACSNAVWLR